MIHPFPGGADVVAVEDDLAAELVQVLLDVVVLDHDDDHVDLVEELVEVEDLVRNDSLVGEEGVEALQWAGEVAFLDVKHLEGRAFTDIIYVLLVGNSVETHTTSVGDTVLLHDLIDAFEDEGRLAVVGLHALVDDLGELGIVPYQEPRIHADAVAADARTRLKDIHTRVHVAYSYDLVHVHVVVTADAGQLVGKGDVDGAEGVLDHLGHFCSPDVSDNDFSLAERGIVFLDLLSNLATVGTDRTVVVEKFIYHITRYYSLRGVDQVDAFDDRPHELIDGAWTDGALYDYGRTFRADFHHVLDGGNDIAGIDLLGELVVRSGHGDDVGVRLLVLGCELYSLGDCRLEQFVKPLLLEGSLSLVQGSHKFLVVVRSDDFNSVRSHHQRRRQSNVAQSDYVDHINISYFNLSIILPQARPSP